MHKKNARDYITYKYLQRIKYQRKKLNILRKDTVENYR